ncbi:hypothetical protein ACTWPB_17765 [Nocardia sp. IBHARD005]|uniref:hypothetical protein n=1 Tax=Nocardia sp. IBHARD005 TaxID=3457765 RepID=UPI004058868D
MSNWQGIVNSILYSVQFESELNDGVVNRIAYALLTEPLSSLTPDDEYQSLSDGLAADTPLPNAVPMRQESTELREFLSRVVARMDNMRPWPELPYHRLPEDSISDFKNAIPIARISSSVNDIETSISRGFYWGTEFGTFIPLKMSSGRVIGMFTPFWDDSDDIVLVDATREPDPSGAIDELLSVTRLDSSKVTRLTAGDLERFTEEYATTPIQPSFRGEHIPGNPVWDGKHVKYLTEADREQFRLAVHDGLLYDSNGNLFDTASARTLWTPNGGRAIFAMDKDGYLYAAPFHILGEFHHSSFLAGEPVAGAGEIAVAQGRVLMISDHSTHYQPARKFTRQVLDSLRRQGAEISDHQVEYHSSV